MNLPDVHLRSKLFELLGGWPTRLTPLVTTLSVEHEDNHVVESLRFTVADVVEKGVEHDVPALLVRPCGEGPFPGVLYCHAHGHRYEIGKAELVQNRSSLPSGPYGPALAASGIASLCIDLECFGERSGVSESGSVKRRLWQGDTLFGAMLRDLAHALDYLAARSDISPDRLATLGLSMGSTQAWWLAALDPRVCAVAELCCLADMATLIELEQHDGHGHYLTVPGLLKVASTAEIAALIAPRPHLVCLGALDSLTPPAAYEPVLEHLHNTYAQLGAAEQLHCVISSDTGHIETPEMRTAVLQFLSTVLRVES